MTQACSAVSFAPLSVVILRAVSVVANDTIPWVPRDATRQGVPPRAQALALVPLIAVAATMPGWWRRRRLVVAAAGVCAIVALLWLQQRALPRAAS